MAKPDDVSTQVVLSSEREIVLTREFDAPRELVWKAWTSAEHLQRWWGPTGFTLTIRRITIAPGGEWRFVMHGPDGRDYENLITFLEVSEHERLVYKHGGGADVEPVNFTVTVSFERLGPSRTRLEMRSVFPSRDARDFVVRTYNAEEGGKQHLTRLGEFVQELRAGSPAADRPFVITRVFNAPRELVWGAWTKREHVMRWFGPKGTTIPSATLDLRVGGTFHYCMRGADMAEHWGLWVFREIEAPERMVFVVTFADAKGSPARAPFDGEWPLETLSTITFEPHAGIGGGTVVTVRWEPLNASEAERRAFQRGFDSMAGGWSGTLDQFAEFIVSQRIGESGKPPTGR